jgi:8-oxo-dGTP pyrophosphatase MutT (NUDIX family)
MIDCWMKEKLRQALASRQRVNISGGGLTESAVLIPIFCKDGEYHILFTQRTDQVPHHKGQISFPGGARSKSDATLQDTALRESREEIGLEANDAEIVGELDDTPTTTSGYNISPFVAFIPHPYKFVLSPYEIKEVFSVPISALLHKANREKGHYIFGGQVYVGYTYEYEGRVIWGATAKIVQQLLEIWQSICRT